jgi:hypothetical protein
MKSDSIVGADPIEQELADELMEVRIIKVKRLITKERIPFRSKR